MKTNERMKLKCNEHIKRKRGIEYRDPGRIRFGQNQQDRGFWPKEISRPKRNLL